MVERAEQGEGAVRGPSRIGQIALPVQDVARATAFYRDALGLEHLFSAPPALSFFRCGEVRLMLSEPEGGADEPGSDASTAPDRSTVLYFDGVPLDAGHARLVEAGAAVVGEPHVVHRTDTMELWMGFYRDSEGNLFALMEERTA